MKRTTRGLVTMAALAFLGIAGTSSAGVRLCYGDPERGAPAHVLEMAARAGSDRDVPGGYGRLLDRVVANRRAVARGEIDPTTAARRGGTAITGHKEFPVLPFLYANTGAEPITTASLDQMLFSGPWPTGTLNEYYQEISYGNLSVGGLVADWTTLAEDDTEYEQGFEYLAFHEVLGARDAEIDFGPFDNDGPDGIPNSGDDDGYVDFAAFVHPEFGGEYDSENSTNIWSHAWILSGSSLGYFETDDDAAAAGIDKIRVDRYFVTGAITDEGAQERIGAFAHEFGHTLGIKDLYDTSDLPRDSRGIGFWGLMASANWNMPERPGHMCAWTKERLGWLQYHNVVQAEQLCLPPAETHPVAARLWTNGDVGPEYFVVENRQPIGFDENVPGAGLVIYHVDETVYDDNESDNAVNADERRKAVDVECADATSAMHILNADDLDAVVNPGDAGDVWCSMTESAFTESSTPDSRSYGGGTTGVRVTEIGDCDGDGNGVICASYDVGIPASVDLCMSDCQGGGCEEISTCDFWWGSPDIWIDNDEDGVHDLPAAGMPNKLWFRVTNDGPNPASNVSVSLEYADPALGALWGPGGTGTVIGEVPITNLDSGQSISDYIVFDYPDTPDDINHYCIGAVATNAIDLQSSTYAPNDNNVAQVNHNILVDRAGGGRSARGGFIDRASRVLIQSGEHSAVFAEIRLGTPPFFNDAVIPAGWDFFYEPGPYFVDAGSPEETYVIMQAAGVQHGDQAYVPVTLWDIERQEAVGGVLFEYRVDSYEPAAPGDVEPLCVERLGDDFGPARVKLEWPKVTQDVASGVEKVSHYEVWRGDDQGNPMALLERVAIDAEPGETGFQFYDTVIWDPETVYTYQVRAADEAGGIGAFGDPIDVACAAPPTVGVGEAVAPISRSYNRPNPFTPRTTITFDVVEAGQARIDVFDASGRVIRSLLDTHADAGRHEVDWDGRDAAGGRVASGIYFYRFESVGHREIRKMVLAR